MFDLFSPDDTVVVAPTPLPWTEQDQLDSEALQRNVARWNETPLSGFVVGSGGGEETYIGEADLFEATRAVSGAAATGKLVIGGIDSPSTTESVRRATWFAESGANLVRVRIPQTPQGANLGNQIEYFEEVSAGSPLPVIVIHQTWQTGGIAATPEEIGEICALDNVAAYIGWHNVRYESYVRRQIPDDVSYWAPNGSLLLPYAMLGATGACAFFADWAPDLVRSVLDLARKGSYDEARRLQERIFWADFIGMTHGVAALKAGLSLLGYEGSVPRSPVPALAHETVEELERAFREAGLMSDD